MIGTAFLATAAVVGPTIANGAESDRSYTRPLPVAQQEAVMHWRLPKVHWLRHVKPHHRDHRASRASSRAPLTGSPQTVAHALVLREGWNEGQWNCLDALWARESGWNTYASNSSSGAYGIPQALPGWKMSAAGSDWRSNPITQIRWGISYIGSKYGSPCTALSHSNSYGYY